MNYGENEKFIIAADSLQELNYKQKKLLLASINEKNADRQKYSAALIKILGAGVYNKLRDKISDGEFRDKACLRLDKAGVGCVTIKSALYPVQLKNIPTPPLALYLRGNPALLKDEMFAVVGSRKTNAQSMQECIKICERLTEKLTVVTGVAAGADSAAAEGALPSRRLICVLPAGHSEPSAANIKILRQVERDGLTLSEFPPEIPAQRYTFVLRNRVIAGLCRGVLVVSAAKKSGALSTASYAADYSREVFAFPYSLGVPSGEGCNALIKSGANLCDDVNDIFSALGLGAAEEKIVELDKDEEELLALLSENGEMHAEQIAEALGKKPYEVAAICSSLEIKALVARTGGNKYCKL